MFDRDTATARSALYFQIREFFRQRDVLEVDVPLLGTGASVDSHMQSMSIDHDGQKRYLQTSPEFFLKRLLCEGSGDIYTICKAFRASERGRFHNPEFSLLEWYRVGFSLEALIQEAVNLLEVLGVVAPVHRLTYGEQFHSVTGLNPHRADYSELLELAAKSGLVGQLDHKGLQEFVMTTLVEPKLPSGLVVLKDYPANQCELAKIGQDCNGDQVAQRFEIYWDGVELANGYDELTNAEEQRARFELARSERIAKSLPEAAFDEKFLGAIDKGLPECAGIALGLDRLLMLLMKHKHLSESLSFSWNEI